VKRPFFMQNTTPLSAQLAISPSLSQPEFDKGLDFAQWHIYRSTIMNVLNDEQPQQFNHGYI